MGRPQREALNRVNTALRMDRDLYARVCDAALDREVSANWLICRLVAEGMERLIPANEIALVRPASSRGDARS